jgi:glycine C-acetyltransferase/8-amino-7-oxononanoate synthase
MQEDLAARLQALDDKSLRRVLRPPITLSDRSVKDGIVAVNFASNDYLGLATEPFIAEGAIEAIYQYGTGAGASRLICGNHAPHQDLEHAIALWKGCEAALAFSSGYATAVGVIPAIVGSQDVVILDKLCHACIIDGTKLSRAVVRIYPHNNLERLEKHLQWARKQHPKARILVATESVFSMDGDRAPLAEIVALKERYGAWLLVDEAHAAGVLGRKGGGLTESLNLNEHVEIQMGTLSKGLGCSGGYICGSKMLIEWLVNKARSLMFSTAPPPANAATAAIAVRWMATEAAHERRTLLWNNVAYLQRLLPEACAAQSPIIPVIVGENSRAVRLSEMLLQSGLLVPAIRYPTVPRDEARVRVTLSAKHSLQSIEDLAHALRHSIDLLKMEKAQ